MRIHATGSNPAPPDCNQRDTIRNSVRLEAVEMSTENVLFSKEYVTPTNAILKHAVVRLITVGTADEIDNITDGSTWQFGVARYAAAAGDRLQARGAGAVPHPGPSRPQTPRWALLPIPPAPSTATMMVMGSS